MKVNDLYEGRLSLLNEKISKIDECINKKDKKNALRLIDDVLEWGWQNDIIYRKKLLVETYSTNDVELLCNKDKFLKNYPAFENAKKFTNADEKPKYELLEKTESLIEKSLETELAKKEFEAKNETGMKEKLLLYKQKMKELKEYAQEKIVRLEEKEKEIGEKVIEFAAVANEYKYKLKNLLSEALKINDYHRLEISEEEKNVWEKQLNDIENKSNTVLKELEQLNSSHPKFKEYSDLVNEQELICKEIEQYRLDFDKLDLEARLLANTIDEITEKYAKVRMDVSNGNFGSVENVLTHERFGEIVKQAMSEAKIGGDKDGK